MNWRKEKKLKKACHGNLCFFLENVHDDTFGLTVSSYQKKITRLAVFLLCSLMLYKVVPTLKTVKILIRKTLLSQDGSEMKFIFVKKKFL